MQSLDKLRVKLFGDGADLESILKLHQDPAIRGFTTNPTLMKKAGITDYEGFARELLSHVTDRPVSFEVFSDDFEEMEAQALEIASWAPNVNVKIPVTNTKGESAAPLIERLSAQDVIVNVTAVFTLSQVLEIADALSERTPAIVSIFAGRIADTGRDPIPVMRMAREILMTRPKAQLLWASPREVLNVYQADLCGCHIITATPDLLAKLKLSGKDLNEYSRETVGMFHDDAAAAGYRIGATEDDKHLAA